MSADSAHFPEECEERLRFETLIAELSSKFVNLPPTQVDDKILEAQRCLCEFLDADLSALWQWSERNTGSFTATHIYSLQHGPQPPIEMTEEDFPWIRREILAGRIVAHRSVEEMPPEAAKDREAARLLGIKSHLTLPLAVGGEPPLGILGFNTTRTERAWPDALVKRLQLVAEIFANALARKRSDEARRASEARLAAGTALAGLGYYEVEFNPPASFTDERLQEICGIPAGRYPNHRSLRFWIEHLHPEDRKMMLEERELLHQGKIQQLSIVYRYLHPCKGQKWLHHLAGVAERDATGRAVRTFGVLRDITQEKAAEAEARDLRDNLTHLTRVNTLGALSGSLAHELNQPLGIILSNAQAAQKLLAQAPPDIAEVQEILSDIVAADRRAGAVIGRLRALLKREDVALRPLSLNHVIEEVLQFTRADLIGRSISVVSQFAPDMPMIAGDRVQLQQVVLNLILNAADAMAGNPPGSRTIYLSTSHQEGRVQAAVRDEGTGLPDSVAQLFQPFYTTKPQGLGLGLAICWSIMATHHGKIWAEPHPGGGAVFRIDLPEENHTTPSVHPFSRPT